MNFERRIPTYEQYALNESISSLGEGIMSELDILAQESDTFEDFIKTFTKYTKDNKINMKVDKGTRDWLEELYNESKKNN